MTPPRLYDDLASWWPLLSPPGDYAEEARRYRDLLLSWGDRPARTLLELGSGGGSNASHLRATFEMTLVDLAPAMVAVSSRLNPGLEHVEGDMRTVRLERHFDRVFVHDAIGYMTTEADLRQAMRTAFVHCRPGGAALFVPDDVRDTFVPRTDHGGIDGEGKALRYLEWAWDPDPHDTSYVVDYTYALRDGDGNVRVEHDRHVQGLFAREVWLRALREVGFAPTVVPVELSDEGYERVEAFVALRGGDPPPWGRA